MPAFLTHYLFADELLAKDEQYREVTILGSQGSDPLFYYGYKIFGKRKALAETRQYGTTIHHIDLSGFVNFVFLKIKKTNNELEKEVLSAYLKGFLMHYVVDRNCHPYVFYRSGFPVEGEPKRNYTFIHSLFESRVDALVFKYKNLPRVGPKKPTKIKNEHLKIVSNVYYEFAIEVLNENKITPLSFYQAVKDMTFANSFLYSRTGLKKKFIEKHLRYTLYNSMSTPLKVEDDDKVDYLNLKKSMWMHPVTGEVSTNPFVELLDIAKEDFSVASSLFEIEDVELLKQKVESFVNNIDHDGSKVGATMKFSDCFFSEDV